MYLFYDIIETRQPILVVVTVGCTICGTRAARVAVVAGAGNHRRDQ